MYGLTVEYGIDAALSPPDLRWRYRAVLARQPGYRRRLDLLGDGWRRIVECYLFADANSARAALDSAERRQFAAAHPACRDSGLALLVREGGPFSPEVILLRRSRAISATGGQVCWRDHLVRDDAALIQW